MDIEILVEKHNNCVKNLDPFKECITCKYFRLQENEEPCKSCYNELLGFPVNPTNWEKI